MYIKLSRCFFTKFLSKKCPSDKIFSIVTGPQKNYKVTLEKSMKKAQIAWWKEAANLFENLEKK